MSSPTPATPAPSTVGPRSGSARRPALSPSRANDFMQCPLLFRFRVVDRLPEPPSSAAARGTLVHAVLERIFDAPLGERTPEAARALLPGEWARLLDTEPRYTSLFEADEAATQAWLSTAEALLGTYFTLEDPNRLEPGDRELWVQTQLTNGPLLRGIVDRLDVAPNGDLRVVDYKTGKSPRPGYEASALFQMRFYALVLWRERAVVPKMLQLIYLGNGQVLRAEPTEADLELTEAKVRSLWAAIETAARAGQWEPRRTPLCGWCAHQELCPLFGGTPPQTSPDAAAAALGLDLGPADQSMRSSTPPLAT